MLQNQDKPDNTVSLLKKGLTILEDIRTGILAMLDNYAKSKRGDSIIESYNVTAGTEEKSLYPPVIKGRRAFWFWLQLDNFDSTNDVKIGINGSPDQGIILKAGKSKTIAYNNLKVDYIRYVAVSGTPSIQIVCARPVL